MYSLGGIGKSASIPSSRKLNQKINYKYRERRDSRTTTTTTKDCSGIFLFPFLLRDLRITREVPDEGVTFSSFPPLPKQKFKLKICGRSTENDTIYIEPTKCHIWL